VPLVILGVAMIDKTLKQNKKEGINKPVKKI